MLVVSPKNNPRDVLEMDPFDFILLLLESGVPWGVDDPSDYFYLLPYDREVLKGGASSRAINPHNCNNTHPQEAPHHSEPWR